MQIGQSYKVVWSGVPQRPQDAGLHGQGGLDLGLELSRLACFLDGIVHEASSLGGSDGLSRSHCRSTEGGEGGAWGRGLWLRGSQW